MTALSHEARERLRKVANDAFIADDSYIAEEDDINGGDLRALLSDSDALAAAERERDEAVRLIGTCAACGKHTVTVWVCQACYIASTPPALEVTP